MISDQEYQTYYDATCRSANAPGVIELLKTGELGFIEGFRKVLLSCNGVPNDLFDQ
jgi:hypothetical protein